MQRELTGFSVTVGLCALLACELDSGAGGPGNGPGTGPEMTVNLLSAAALDGWVRSDGNSGATGGPPITGDLGAPALGYRQFYSFDLSPVPAGSTITLATLQLYQAAVGGNPYVDLGNVIVDHVDYGAALGAVAYSVTALASNIGVLSSDVTIAYKTLVVTARVQADVAGARTRSQFRVRFSNVDSNNDAGIDFAQFTDAEFLGANVPVLVVKYRQ